MDLLLKICIYSVLALALFAANVIFLRSAYRTFSQRGSVKSIAPFEVVGLGKDYDAAAHGAAMARMLRARLMRIQDEMASLQALSAPPAPSSDTSAVPQVQPTVEALDLPQRIFAPVDLQLEIAGVQVSGLLARFQAAAAERDTLRFVVRYRDKLVTVAGDDGSRDFSLWLDEAERSDSQIVEQIAYALVHRQVGRRVPEVNALDGDEFQLLLKTLYELSQLNQRIARGRLVAAEPFEKVLPSLNRIVDRAPRWRELVRVTAQTAELAGRNDRALELYKREREATATGEQALLTQKIGDLEARLAPRYTAAHPSPPAPRPSTGGAASAPAPVASGGAPARPVPAATSAEERIRELLGVSSSTMSRAVTIGIVGGPPLGMEESPQLRILSSSRTSSGEGDRDGMQEYATSVLQAARIVAPEAKYVFAPLSGSSFMDVAEAAAQLQDSDVVIIGYKFPETHAELQARLERLADRSVLAVFSAGNDGRSDARSIVPRERALLAGAVDLNARRAPFSNGGNVWAPGVSIPMKPPVRGGPRDGTAYSAALAAAVAARVLAERDLPPERLVRLLVETSVKSAEGVPVLNLANALKRGT